MLSSAVTCADPDLSHLLGAYLHQDFDIFGQTPADAGRAFLRDDPSDAIAATRADIARMQLAHARDLDDTLRALEPGQSRPPGMDAGAFLDWLDDLLAAGTHASHRAAE